MQTKKNYKHEKNSTCNLLQKLDIFFINRHFLKRKKKLISEIAKHFLLHTLENVLNNHIFFLFQ